MLEVLVEVRDVGVHRHLKQNGGKVGKAWPMFLQHAIRDLPTASARVGF